MAEDAELENLFSYIAKFSDVLLKGKICSNLPDLGLFLKFIPFYYSSYAAALTIDDVWEVVVWWFVT